MARIIADLQISGKTVWKYCEQKNMSVLLEKLQAYLDGYLNLRIQSGNKEATIRRLRTALRHFPLYAASLGYGELLFFTEKDALAYIPVLSESYQHTGDCLSLLRPFGKYLFSQRFTAIRLDNIFLVKAPVRNKCIEGFSESECARIVQNVDRKEPCGKRDYAILMLPIPVSVLNALADYILTSRPETVGEDSFFEKSTAVSTNENMVRKVPC